MGYFVGKGLRCHLQRIKRGLINTDRNPLVVRQAFLHGQGGHTQDIGEIWRDGQAINRPLIILEHFAQALTQHRVVYQAIRFYDKKTVGKRVRF